ncbi:MAG TPA: hypothetical protein VFG01_03235 [Acidobacteriota bacterium]|nr:hypothetical protein [Acidobacteriota bacterium]
MKTIAFITRVHPARPNMLRTCKESVKKQTCDDYLHILHRNDNTESGYGVSKANLAMKKVRPINAQYVMVLDDDDMLIDRDFVKTIKKETETNKPEIIFFKGIINERWTYPKPNIWGKAPKFALIASFCFAVRRDIWMANIHEFGKPTMAGVGGDFSFISACYKRTKNHLWLDRIVAKTQKKQGRGKGERGHA